MPSTLRIEIAAATSAGRLRRTNADAYLIDESAGLLAVADGMGEGLIETVLEQLAVGQPGQGIVLGEVGNARFGSLALGDVRKNRHIVGGPFERVAYRADRQG